MILFRFSLRLGGRVLAATRPASSTTADTSQSVLIVMIQACLTVNLWSPFESNWSVSCQLAACSEVLAEWTRFIPALPTSLPRFFPSLPEKKKMQWVCSILEIRLVWLNCGWCANSPKLSSDSVNLIYRYHWSSHERKKSWEGKRDRHVLHKKLYFQNSMSSECRTCKYTCKAEHILLFHHLANTTNTSSSFKMTISTELWKFLIKMTNDDYW